MKKLHTNQRLLVEELQRRKVKVSLIDQEIELLEAEYKGHKEFLLDRYSSIFPFPVTKFSSDKYLVKCMLRDNNISVPEGSLFDRTNQAAAFEYAKTLHFPIVLKPNWGSHGDHVYMNIDGISKLKKTIEIFIEENKDMPFIIEEQFEGKEYRIFITRNDDFAAVYREPAFVIGNGINTIEQLAIKESDLRMNPRTTCLCPVSIDPEVVDFLQMQNKDLNFIPDKDEKIYLRSNSNVSKGGFCEDATDIVHPDIIKIAKKVLSIFRGMPYLGIDLISKNISDKQSKNTYRIIEINSNPGFTLHMLPGKGKARNVAGYAADLIFPETIIF